MSCDFFSAGYQVSMVAKNDVHFYFASKQNMALPPSSFERKLNITHLFSPRSANRHRYALRHNGAVCFRYRQWTSL